jgi:ATP-dependent DNA ligase
MSNILAYRILGNNELTLNQLLKYIIEEAGEGVILRKCTSLYEHGRSADLLKLKVSCINVY